MGKVITLLILTVTYYLVITPTGLLKYLLGGGRPLPLKPDRSSASYWVEREEAVQPKERFLKRY